MIDKTLQELIDFIKSAAPVLWEVLVKQVYADIATYLIWTVITAVMAYFLIKIAKKMLKEDELNPLGFFSAFGGATALILSPVLLTQAVRMLINPYYYAITNILATLKGN